MPAMMTRLMRVLKARHAMVGSLLSLTIKASGAVLMVIVFILTARAIDPTSFGRLAVAYNVLSLLAVWALFGQDTLFVRSWGEYFGREAALAHGAYWFGWRVVAIGASLACLAVVAIATLGPWSFPRAEILAGCIFLAAQITLQYSSNTCRHILNFVISEVNREIVWRLVLLATVFLGLHVGFSPEVFFLAAAAGMLLGFAIETAALLPRFPAAVRAAPVQTRAADWLARARSMWISACIESATQYTDVMLLGFLVSPAAAGDYFVAARIANIFAMLTTGLHTYTVSYAANLFFSRQTDRLQAILRSVMAVALCMTTPIALVIAFAGSHVLGLFGAHYAGETETLLLLAGTSYVGTLAGPASGLLQITGHERLYSRIASCALLIRLGLLGWLAPRYGALGAALAWTAVNVPLSVGLSIACHPLCGMDPSVVSIFTRRPAAPGAVVDPA